MGHASRFPVTIENKQTGIRPARDQQPVVRQDLDAILLARASADGTCRRLTWTPGDEIRPHEWGDQQRLLHVCDTVGRGQILGLERDTHLAALDLVDAIGTGVREFRTEPRISYVQRAVR